MTLGEKVKEAIQKAGYKTEDVADQIGISEGNLYKLYKKDSFEVKYLLGIAKLLELPLGYFLNDETINAALHQTGIGNAGRDISNQNIINGDHNTGRTGANIATGELEYRLQLCEAEKKSLQSQLELKDQLIGMQKEMIEQLKK